MVIDFINGADVFVVQRRSRARFLAEAFEGRRTLDDVTGQKFERDVAAKTDVFGFIHNAHTAAAQLTKNFEV